MRSPSINELFSFQQFQGGGFDPCTFDHDNFLFTQNTSNGQIVILPTPELDAICLAQGMPEENLYNDNVLDPSITSFVNEGGNPNLLAEDASTFSIGVVWTPYFLDGLSVSIDFFDVEIENYIERTL